MKKFTREEIGRLDRIYRLNLINSISGYKSANLIGTKGESGENLAIISSVIHLGSKPALLGFIMRPDNDQRHTLSNIKATKKYTINAVSDDFVKNAHYTSANFEKGVSEFEACNLTAEYLSNFPAPFVKQSQLKIAMQVEQLIPIELNGTIMIVGSVQEVFVNDKCLLENGQLDLNAINVSCVSGLNRYHQVKEIAKFSYARVDELPNFK